MKKSFLAIIILVAISCGSDKVDDTIIGEKEMINILIDFHLSQATVQNFRLKADSAKVVFNAQNKFILYKYQITDSTFLNSYNYYLAHPKELEKIYSAIVDSLSLQQSLMKEAKK